MYPPRFSYDTYETYESPASEFNANKAINYIKLTQQNHRQELEKKDEKIKVLENKLLKLTKYNRELVSQVTNYEQHNDEEDSHLRDLCKTNHLLQKELAMEKEKSEDLESELTRLRHELSRQEDRIAHLDAEHEKAQHIIKTLVKKVTNQQHQHAQRSPLPQTNGGGGGGGVLRGSGISHHNRIVT
jgi:chromosome segregation ATPase